MSNIIEDRIKVSKLIFDVLLEKSSVLEALKNFPKDSVDASVNTCFHILVHYESDADIRKKDILYKEVQEDFLIETAQTLSKGNPLPANIIAEYKEFYGSDLFYKKPTSENLLKRLLKSINL